MKLGYKSKITIVLLFLFSFSVYPQSYQFYLTDSLHIPRMEHTVITMQDSNVLVIGGYNQATKICEIYDHINHVWFMTDTLNFQRSEPQAVLLPDGNILIVGGSPDSSNEIFDSKTRTWKLIKAENIQRFSGHCLNILTNGKVLVSGGYSFSTHLYLRECEIFDPATYSWSIVDSMNFTRMGHTATLMQDGRIFVCGGAGEGKVLKACEIYDPTINKWLIADSMKTERTGHTATLLPNGKILVAGGTNWSELAIKSCEMYDPITNSWQNINGLRFYKAFHSAFLIPGERILFVGGSYDYGRFEIYNYESFNTDYVGIIQDARDAACFAQIDSITILAVGGVTWINSTYYPSKICNLLTVTTNIIDDKLESCEQLFQNYPNPFNPTTMIKYTLSSESDVELKIYDMMGREVRTLVNGNNSIGYKEIMWDGKNNNGILVSGGVYIYRLIAKSFVEGKIYEKSAKMILMK